MFKDITQAHNLEKIKSENKYKSVLMGWLTHELRTPVNLVISGLSSLEYYHNHPDIVCSNSEKLFRIWIGSVQMLKNLVEDFIDFTRIDNRNPISVFKENVNTRELIEEVEGMFELQAQEKELGWNVWIDQDTPMYLRTDAVRLKQVLLNLLSNSMKFTKKGSISIEVTKDKKSFIKNNLDEEEVKQPKGRNKIWKPKSLPMNKRNSKCLSFAHKNNWTSYLHIKIRDTGIGMTESEVQGLFKKFHVLNSSREMNRSGLGLGLYLSKQILIQLGGDIYWESTQGVGTTFIIEFAIDPRVEIFDILDGSETPIKSRLGRQFGKPRLKIVSHQINFEWNEDSINEEPSITQSPYNFLKTNDRRDKNFKNPDRGKGLAKSRRLRLTKCGSKTRKSVAPLDLEE